MKLSRQIGAFFLLALLFVKAMIIPAIFVDYEIRKDFIIENYCVNKDRPELKCDGKCYLAQQIKKAQQEDENQAQDTFLSKVFEVETKLGLLSFLFEADFSIKSEEMFFDYTSTQPVASFDSVFHPPKG